MKEISIVIIDDSSIIHALLNRIISQAEGLKVAGNAYNGKDGIAIVKQLSPDVIIMDITMQGMSGLDAISIIMEENPTPIIVFSAASKSIVDLSFQAIDRGAVEIIEKPFAEDINDLQKIINEKLLKSIKTFADFRVIRRINKSTVSRLQKKAYELSPLKTRRLHQRPKPVEKKQEEPEEDIFNKPPSNNTFLVVAIASSTGGPQTIKQLLSAVSYKSAPCSYIIVQHMAMGFIKGFCDWLNLDSHIPVEIAPDKAYVYPNRIYIAQEGYHLTIDEEYKFRYLSDPPVMGIRPSANILFQSLARVYKSRTIAIVLTGMGRDGARGVVDIKKSGGYVIAQDEASCYIFGMPKAAIETGVTDKILSIYEMPNFLEELYNERYCANS